MTAEAPLDLCQQLLAGNGEPTFSAGRAKPGQRPAGLEQGQSSEQNLLES